MSHQYGAKVWMRRGAYGPEDAHQMAYPQRPPVAYPVNSMYQGHHPPPLMPPTSSNQPKSRTFTGVITKVTENGGFVDDDVYFSLNCCDKQHPVVGDRVFVTASYHSNGPHRWSASRVQVVSGDPRDKYQTGGSRDRDSSYKRERSPFKGKDSDRRDEGDRKRRRMERSRERRDRYQRERDRSRDRGKDRVRETDAERVRSPASSRRSRSPTRYRRPIRYVVRVPNEPLTLPEYDIALLKKRFPSLHVPSDFFASSSKWLEIFLYDKPFSLEQPCSFHIMHKECDAYFENNAVYDVPDLDYLYSVKVMLMSVPTMEEIYKKCVTFTEDEEKGVDHTVHLSRIIQFLVGMRKSDPSPIGGPWSPSLDGLNPDKDPSVLIKTAKRTCKALTGIDLSDCTQWYRFLEIYYHRSESVYKGKTIPARVETVVYFIPEVWTCAPTQLDWQDIQNNYKNILEAKINPQSSTLTATPTTITEHTKVEEEKHADSQTAVVDKEEEMVVIDKCEPTHYSQLDVKTMKVQELRQELEARNLSSKGLKAQLVNRLSKALATEQKQEEEEAAEKTKQEQSSEIEKPKQEEEEMEITVLDEVGDDTPQENADAQQQDEKQPDDANATEVKEEEKEKEPEVKEMSESERALWTKRYTLPDAPHIIVHPSKTAKSGHFDCSVISLHSLLDYRADIGKESTFEATLFAELFNDMLIRDFGYKILKAFCEAPEKRKEEKEKPKEENSEKQKEKEAEKPKENADEKITPADIAEATLETEQPTVEAESAINETKENGEVKDEKEEKSKNDKTVEEKQEKKELPVKMYTRNRSLLLAFSYFDRSGVGYIFDNDLEPLFISLGLALSRSQIKKLINRVSSRDTVHYRKLTDAPKKEEEDEKGEEKEMEVKAENGELPEDKMAAFLENKKFLGAYKDTEISYPKRQGRKSKSDAQAVQSGGFVNYGGSLLDIENLLKSSKRNEATRVELERQVYYLKTENDKLKDSTKRSAEKTKAASGDLQTCRDKIITLNKEIISLKGKMRTFTRTMSSIKDQIIPLLEEAVEKKPASDDTPVTSDDPLQEQTDTTNPDEELGEANIVLDTAGPDDE